MNPTSASTLLRDGDRNLILSPDARWLVTCGSDEELSLNRQFETTRDPQEHGDLLQKREHVVRVVAVLDLTAKDIVSTRHVLPANASEPLGVSHEGHWLLTQ